MHAVAFAAFVAITRKCWTTRRGWFAQVVHGDMKSQNVLLSRNWDIAKIADAGVARFAQAVDVIGNEGVASVLSLLQDIVLCCTCVTLVNSCAGIPLDAAPTPVWPVN